MSDLYSDLPSASKGDGNTARPWLQRQGPVRRPGAPPAVITGGFNPLGTHAPSQSPLLAASADDDDTARKMAVIQERIALASAKLAAATKVAGLATAAASSPTAAAAASTTGATTAATTTTTAASTTTATATATANGTTVTAAAAAAAEKDMFPVLADEYDPARPNDYAEYCERRLAIKKKEAAQRDLERQLKKLEEDRKRQKEEEASSNFASLRSAAVDAAASGGRGRGKGLTVPAWMTNASAAAAAAGAGAADSARTGPPPPPPPAVPGQFDDPAAGASGPVKRKGATIVPAFGGASLDKAAQIMDRMGYQPGRGLGAKEDGITGALVHQPTGGGRGKLVAPPPPPPPGFRAPAAAAAAAAATAAPPPPTTTTTPGLGAPGGAAGAGMEPPAPRKVGVKNPSPVILLRNMVDPGEVCTRVDSGLGRVIFPRAGSAQQRARSRPHEFECPATRGSFAGGRRVDFVAGVWLVFS
jgi:hypothetical protein